MKEKRKESHALTFQIFFQEKKIQARNFAEKIPDQRNSYSLRIPPPPPPPPNNFPNGPIPF